MWRCEQRQCGGEGPQPRGNGLGAQPRGSGREVGHPTSSDQTAVSVAPGGCAGAPHMSTYPPRTRKVPRARCCETPTPGWGKTAVRKGKIKNPLKPGNRGQHQRHRTMSPGIARGQQGDHTQRVGLYQRCRHGGEGAQPRVNRLGTQTSVKTRGFGYPTRPD